MGSDPTAAISALTTCHATYVLCIAICRRCSAVSNASLSHPARMLARLWWAGPSLLLSYLSLFVSRVGSVNPVEYWGESSDDRTKTFKGLSLRS